jgi:HD-like signal output (HDOD) protein
MAYITRETVAEKLAAYLRHDLSLAELVSWAESALMESEFDPAHFDTIRDAIARLGVADVRAFGLAWEDCEQLLARLGYSAQVSIVAR